MRRLLTLYLPTSRSRWSDVAGRPGPRHDRPGLSADRPLEQPLSFWFAADALAGELPYQAAC